MTHQRRWTLVCLACVLTAMTAGCGWAVPLVQGAALSAGTHVGLFGLFNFIDGLSYAAN